MASSIGANNSTIPAINLPDCSKEKDEITSPVAHRAL